jgi:RNA polymerase sigma-70 factor (ECF subfamily)
MINHLCDIQVKIAVGDEDALSELYQLFHKRLHQFARVITRSDEIAKEVVNDVFVKLWSNRDKINEIENLTVYLYVAVKNRSVNELSRKAKELVNTPFDYFDIELKESAANPHELMVTTEIMQRMQKAVDALPPRCKMIFKLVREDGLKYKEVAQILNISVNTIDVQMAIAVKKICTALQIKSPQTTPASFIEQKKI